MHVLIPDRGVPKLIIAPVAYRGVRKNGGDQPRELRRSLSATCPRSVVSTKSAHRAAFCLLATLGGIPRLRDFHGPALASGGIWRFAPKAIFTWSRARRSRAPAA